MRRVKDILLAVLPILLAGPANLTAQSYRLYGLNFSPYLDGQSPDLGTRISEAQIRQRLAIIAPDTRWVRTFGATDGLENVPRIAREFGLQVAMGAWLSADLATNELQLAALIAAARDGYVDLAIVGSEVLLRHDLTEQQLIGYINRFRQQVPGVPVTTADVYSELLSRAALLSAVDVVLANYYPYWEGASVDVAVAVLHGWHQLVRAASGGKPVIVSESGWPSAGNTIGSAVPSASNASAFFLNFVSWARANGTPYFYFEAFDESWKAVYEGPQGAAWGIWDKNGVLKPGMQAAFNGNTVPDNWSGNALPGGPGTPSLDFTFVTPYGSTAKLEGQAWHVAPAQFRVVVFIQVSAQWWTKPFQNQPVTQLLPDGSFQTAIVTGGFDQQATRIIAFLIPNSYTPPLLLGAASIPQELYVNAAAYRDVTRTPASISGRVTDSFGIGVKEVTLELAGPVALRTTTQATGDYSFYDLTAGANYTVTPSRPGFRFQPVSASLANVTGGAGQDFSASSLPAPPTLVYPPDGSTGIPSTATLTWTAAFPAAGYDVQLGPSLPPPYVGSTAGTVYSTPLVPGTKYYWRTIAKNTSGTSPSPIWSFTTSPADGIAPSCVITAPTANATFTTNASSITLSGTCTDNTGVTQVTWENDRGGRGVAAGTATWTVGPIALLPGVNVVTIRATDTVGNQGADVITVEYRPTQGAALRFVAVTPCRLMDTRAGQGRSGPFGPPILEAAQTRTVPVPQGACGIPATARAYSLNFTVVPSGPLSFLTTWPVGLSQPLVSTLNSFEGRVVANAALVPAGVGGSIQVFVTDRTEVIVDVNGYFVEQ